MHGTLWKWSSYPVSAMLSGLHCLALLVPTILTPDLSEWLESTLGEAESVVADAEAVGVHAARDKLCTIIGRTRLAPCPRATGDAGRTAVETVIKVFDRLVAMMNVGLKIRGLLTE